MVNNFWADIFYDIDRGVDRELVISWADEQIRSRLDQAIDAIEELEVKKALDKLKALKEEFNT